MKTAPKKIRHTGFISFIIVVSKKYLVDFVICADYVGFNIREKNKTKLRATQRNV